MFNFPKINSPFGPETPTITVVVCLGVAAIGATLLILTHPVDGVDGPVSQTPTSSATYELGAPPVLDPAIFDVQSDPVALAYDDGYDEGYTDGTMDGFDTGYSEHEDVLNLVSIEFIDSQAECLEEDSAGPCAWDAEIRGNHIGCSFYVDAQQEVWYATPDCRDK